MLRRLAALWLLAGLALLAATPGAAAQDGPTVDVLEISGVIDQSIADFVAEVIDEVNDDGGEVLVLQINTPGGLGVSMEAIVDDIVNSRVPVAVWVGPPGAQAASAGMFIGYAADVLAMAPATTIGAATPVDLGGSDLDAKVRNAAAARLVGLAELQGHSTEFARAAVLDGAVAVALPEGEDALPDDADLPEGVDRDDVRALRPEALVSENIADFVAPTLPEVLAALDGREVEVGTADGDTETRTLDVDERLANVRFHNLGLVRRVLHTVANPTLAYLLIMAGALAMLFEVFQPGFGVAGVTGLVLFGLGLYGLSVLPVNWLAFALILLGLALLAADLAIAGLGALTAAGTVALGVGSFLLFTGPELLRISPWLIGGVVAWNLVFFVVIMTTVLRAQAGQAMTGAEGLVGKVGVVRSMLNPEGHVFVDGALWRARAPEGTGKVKTGTRVRILGLRDGGLTLDVELLDESAPVGSVD
jgi:membrane-bound serine protease (ClpP class)